MNRTGLTGHSSAHAQAAASSVMATMTAFLIFRVLLELAGREHFELRAERGLYATIFGLHLGDDPARLFGVGAARRGLDITAIAAQEARADVGAARLERMGRARKLGGIARRGRLLQLLHEFW